MSEVHLYLSLPRLGCRVQGLGRRVEELGCRVDVRDSYNRTALHYAVRGKRPTVCVCVCVCVCVYL